MNDATRRAWRDAPFSMAGATVFGIGHLPGGPGTYAAALWVPVAVWSSGLSWVVRLGAWALLTGLSIVWAKRAGRALDEPDSRRIVIDEVVGVWTSLVVFSTLTWPGALAGFIAFRILDIVKTPLGRRLDAHAGGGWSVIADDIVAGVWAIPFVALIEWML